MSRRQLVGALAAAIVAVGVALAVALLMPRGPEVDDATKAAINELLDRRYDAAANRDIDAFMSTVDPARSFLRDCARQRFEAYLRNDDAPNDATAERDSVDRMDRLGDYVRIWMGYEGGRYRRFARQEGGRWYMSEPFPRELGENLSAVYAGVKVHYQAADAEIASAVGSDLTTIMARASAHAAEPPSQFFEINVVSLADRGGACFRSGAAADWGTTIITLYDVELTPTYEHITSDTAVTIEHEALHWLQFQHISRAKLRKEPDWWVIEGWPTFISALPSRSDRRDAACIAPPSYDDLRLGPRPTSKVEEVGRMYTIAAMLVERIYGVSNDTAYWQFFDDFGATTDPYLRATGSDGRSFYNAWLDDARHEYCCTL